MRYQASPTLPDLPTELLDDILSQLYQSGMKEQWQCDDASFWTTPSSSRDLAAVAATCKRLNDVATPHLYFAPTASSHYLLLRTLLERPELAALVRALDSQGWYSSEEEEIAIHDIVAIQKAAQRLNLDLPPDWFKLREHRKFGYYPLCIFDVLLAVVASNLEALLFNPNVLTGSPEFLVKSGINFPRLRFLAISKLCRTESNDGRYPCWVFQDGQTVNVYGPTYGAELINKCPKLETLWYYFWDELPSIEIPLRKLKSLRLFRSQIRDPFSLENMLRACPVLEDFCYITDSPHEWEPFSFGPYRAGAGSAGWNLHSFSHTELRLTPHMILRFLQPVAGHLKHLDLWPQYGGRGLGPGSSSEQEISTLSSFQKLETLRIHAHNFEPNAFDLFSSTVRYLCIRRADVPDEPLTQALEMGQTFPVLNVLAVESDFRDEELQAACTAKGVRYIHVGYPDKKVAIPEKDHTIPTYDFCPGKDFLRPNSNDW